MNKFSDIPSVDKMLGLPGLLPLIKIHGRPHTLDALRQVLTLVREEITNEDYQFSEDTLIDQVKSLLSRETKPSLIKVINASGVILHTNLGRAPLSEAALAAVNETTRGFSNLEFDLEKGERGSRSTHARELLCRLTGVEDALVVNNNAAAVLLCLSALANRKKVVISRSQLVEIGGGFRVPDVMRQSGAKLVEVGTTNRVHLADYENALKEGASLVMRAHSSNFRLVGFTTEPALEEIIALSHRYAVPFMDDLGSGALLDTSIYGIAKEPTIQDSLKAGADLVCFSGDKLLGGPQAGIILGKRDLIAKIKKHPLARAVRADKLCLAALTATLLHYLNDEAVREIPVWRMISNPLEKIRTRALEWQERVGDGEVIESVSTIGGGSLPEETLPTFVLAIKVKGINDFMSQLRKSSPPVVGRIQDDKALFDPRTVSETEDECFVKTIKSTLSRRNS